MAFVVTKFLKKQGGEAYGIGPTRQSERRK